MLSDPLEEEERRLPSMGELLSGPPDDEPRREKVGLDSGCASNREVCSSLSTPVMGGGVAVFGPNFGFLEPALLKSLLVSCLI